MRRDPIMNSGKCGETQLCTYSHTYSTLHVVLLLWERRVWEISESLDTSQVCRGVEKLPIESCHTTFQQRVVCFTPQSRARSSTPRAGCSHKAVPGNPSPEQEQEVLPWANHNWANLGPYLGPTPNCFVVQHNAFCEVPWRVSELL